MTDNELLGAYGQMLMIASKLAHLKNDIEPIIEVRRKIPQEVKDALGIEGPDRPTHKNNRCADCSQRISASKIRCLFCYAEWLERNRPKEEGMIQ